MIYTIFKAYRPITLLKTPNKILESIMAKKIIYLAEEHSLLPVTQMGARRGRSTEFALELFTEQIHSVGSTEKQNGYAAKHGRSGCFQYDVSSAATPQFTPKKILRWITDRVDNFLQNRTTTSTISVKSTETFAIRTGILQGSPLSP